jgi:hypothetical protein
MLQTSAIGFSVCLALGTGCGDVGSAEVEGVDAAYTLRDCAARFDACAEGGREPEACREGYAACIDGADEDTRGCSGAVEPTFWELTERQCWRDFDVCTEAGVTPERCRARLGQCLELVAEGDARPVEGDARPVDDDERPIEPPQDGGDRCRAAYGTCLQAAPDPERCRAEFDRCEATDAPSDERPPADEAPSCDRGFDVCVAAGYDENTCAERLRAGEADATR